MSRPVFVPVGKGHKKNVAVISQEDWELLNTLGCSPSWNLNANGQVIAPAARAPGRNVRVGRVLMDAEAGEEVRFKDGNRLNMQRNNLELVKGTSLVRDRSLLTPDSKQRRKKRKAVYVLNV